MYTKNELKNMSLDELVNLVNQLEEERDMYRDKWQKFAKKQSENRANIANSPNLHNVYRTRQEAIDAAMKMKQYNSILL
jgi:predicted patatin/cPLA2 family phospholipase